MPVDPAKIAALKNKSAAKAGGLRRKVAPVLKDDVVHEDKKIRTALNRFQLREIGFESAQIYQGENVLDFQRSKIQMVPGANCYMISGKPVVKSAADYTANQFRSMLTPEMLNMLSQVGKGAGAGAGAADLPSFPGSFE